MTLKYPQYSTKETRYYYVSQTQQIPKKLYLRTNMVFENLSSRRHVPDVKSVQLMIFATSQQGRWLLGVKFQTIDSHLHDQLAQRLI